jgi:hypothetical protein
MKRSVLRRSRAVLAASAIAALGCSQETATATLRALDPVGEVSLICLGRDESGAFTRGHSRSDCPDYEFPLASPNNRRFHALVTQPLTGEVALVDLAVSAAEAVIDYEPTQPGYSFMPVGAEPGSLVSTPGGVASFVGVREAGREGIFALPSSCLAPRPADAPVRDIRTWPACRLPAAPGPMVMLIDPAVDDGTSPARVRTSCADAYVDAAELVGQSPGATRAECPADLATETSSPGRRMLGVMMPSLSELWVLDAQQLLDRTPGSFDACSVEERYPLGSTTTDAVQQVPPDLVPSSPSCMPVGFNHGPPTDTYRPWPVDLALDDEQRLYVADSDAPLVHVLDVSDPCNLSALPSLEPRSFTDPSAVITTRRVAVSPLTPLGKRYVYAVDGSTTITAGTIMMFDVSPGSTDRTPIVRPRSPFNPNEPADRIALGRDVSDIEFVFQDSPEPAAGVAVEGVACDPDPASSLDTPGAEYRPTSDLSAGASPRKLRGTFAFASLYSGQVAVIDVEDLDAACRRPVAVNPTASDDLNGCSIDPNLPGGYSIASLGNLPTVTNELSCNVVAPHRTRSRSYFTNNGGTARSAGLLSFPTFTLDTGRSVTTDQSNEGKDYPKLLGARHVAGQEESVFVGPLVYRTDDPQNILDVDPAQAERSSVLLSYEEPRAYIPGEDFLAIYEGVVRTSSTAVFSVDPTTGYGRVNEGLNASFCSSGVQDMDLVLEMGRELGVSPANEAAFVRRHADYVQIIGDLLEEDDPYWSAPNPGASCNAELFQIEGNPPVVPGRPLCDQFFLPAELQNEHRDFRIVEASEDGLLIEPRDSVARGSEARRRQLSEFAACCFPDATAFQIRAGHQWTVRGAAIGFSHAVTTDPTSLRCVADCNPIASRLRGRAFEISCSENCDAQSLAAVGPATADDVACVVDSTENGIDPGEPGSQCVFQNLTTRFAIYRGQQASARDMRFRWQFSDGFTPLVIGLTTVDRSRSTPQSLLSWPESSQIIVSDGSARGLTFVSSRSLGTIASIF